MLRAKITGIQGREYLNILTHHSIETQDMLFFFLTFKFKYKFNKHDIIYELLSFRGAGCQI